MISRSQELRSAEKISKIDLHCHLDGSVPFAFTKHVCRMRGEDYSDAEIIRQMQVDEGCRSLTQYLEKFDLSIRCMSEPDLIEQASEAFMESLVPDKVKYVEVRFSPALLQTKDMGERQILKCVLKGLERGGRRHGIFYQVIVCAMRHFNEEANLSTFRTAAEFLGGGVCAVDLAGDESRYPTETFRNLFRRASQMHFPITIHAGECGDVESIRHAVAMGAVRIGHGIAMRGHEEVEKICQEKRIGIEMCPVSNMQTGAVKSISEYPLREFMEHQLCVTVNTDNRTVSNTSLVKELQFLEKNINLTRQEMFWLQRNAVFASFAPETVKRTLYQILDEEEKGYGDTTQ